MNKFFAPRMFFALVLFAVIMFAAACRNANPTSTPVPPTVDVPTALPPAPTAPPLTAAPTAVLPTQAPPPAATAVVPTNAPPAPTNTATSGGSVPPNNPTASSTNNNNNNNNAPAPIVERGPLTGLYIAALRFEPTYPVKNTPIMFYATLINRSGKEQYYPVCAEIFRPDAKKSFGITNCDNLTIPVGTNEIFVGSWIATGIKECIPVRARAVLREQDEDDIRLVFTNTNGGELWTDFNMCP